MTSVPQAAFRRIVDTAAAQLEVDGEAGLSLRSVARAVGVSVQSLYHYVDSRAALVDILVEESADDLAAAVTEAAGDHAEAEVEECLVAVARAFRCWAHARPAAFSLLHGRGWSGGLCACTGPALRLRRALLGVLGDPPASADALLPFWAVVAVLAAHRHDDDRAGGGAWEPLVRSAADAAARHRAPPNPGDGHGAAADPRSPAGVIGCRVA